MFGYSWSEDGGPGGPCGRVIILEEDLQVAPDFFAYFRALERLLDQDHDLLGGEDIVFGIYIYMCMCTLLTTRRAHSLLLAVFSCICLER